LADQIGAQRLRWQALVMNKPPPMEPDLVTDASLLDVLEALKQHEPIFHRHELVSYREDLERETAEDFLEVGASGRRYSREFV